MTLTPIEEAAFNLIESDIKLLVHEKLSSNRISVIGSYSTGLATPSSQIEFSLSLPSFEKDPMTRGPSSARPEALRAGRIALGTIHEALLKSNGYRDINLSRSHGALVTATHCQTGLTIQISTLTSPLPTQEYTIAYLSEYPTLRPLFFLLRYVLETRNLTNVYEGGFGAYSILIMIVAALKHAEGQFAPDDLANHLIYILKFYAGANLYKFGFSADPPRVLPKRASPKARYHDRLASLYPRKPYLLYLRDPANSLNDLGSKAYAIKHVQKLLGLAMTSILDNVECWDRESPGKRRAREGGILNPLVMANYTVFEKGRERVRKSMASLEVGSKFNVGTTVDLSARPGPRSPVASHEESSIKKLETGQARDVERSRHMIRSKKQKAMEASVLDVGSDAHGAAQPSSISREPENMIQRSW